LIPISTFSTIMRKNIITVIPPNPFNPKELFKNISNLRDGSDRLVKNFQSKFPKIYRELLELKETSSIFEVVAIILELEEKSLESLLKQSFGVYGKRWHKDRYECER